MFVLVTVFACPMMEYSRKYVPDSVLSAHTAYITELQIQIYLSCYSTWLCLCPGVDNMKRATRRYARRQVKWITNRFLKSRLTLTHGKLHLQAYLLCLGVNSLWTGRQLVCVNDGVCEQVVP